MVPHQSLNFTWHHFTLSMFFSVLLLHSGHTSKQQFFHCFSIVSRMLYAIMVPHRSLNFTWHYFTLSLSTSEPQFYLASFYPLPILSHRFHCFPIFSILLCQSPSILLGIILPSPCFFSVLLLRSGHTSKQQFFHCFSIVSRMLYAIMVPHRSLNYLASFYPLAIHIGTSILLGIILPSPYSFHRFHCFPIFFPFFYVKVPPFFHCFYHLMSYSLIFSIVFLINLPRIHLGGRTRGESIPQRHPIATWYITQKKVYLVHLFYHLFSSFLSLSGRSAPRPP